jgi:hypothetical protein
MVMRPARLRKRITPPAPPTVRSPAFVQPPLSRTVTAPASVPPTKALLLETLPLPAIEHFLIILSH